MIPVSTSGASTEPAGSASTILVFGEAFAHVAPDAGKRAAGADADHHRIDIAAHLAKDLGRGRRLVGGGVCRIGELVGVEGARRPFGNRQREVLVVIRVALADVGAGDDHLGAERAGVQDLLARHLVGHDEDGAVALARGDQGKPDAGVAGGRLDDRAALLQAPVRLGGVDHSARRPVLDRAARVCRFELQEQPARAQVEARDLDERRLANEVEDARRRHADILPGCRTHIEGSVGRTKPRLRPSSRLHP